MADRGKVVDAELSNPIIFNEEIYSKVRIEIDHINYGLDQKTKELNKVRRSKFSPEDICQIILQLDGMELIAEKESEHFDYFALDLLNPLKGINMGKKYRLIFTIARIKDETIGTVTLYRVK